MYERLMEAAVEEENGQQALKAVKRNKGAAGIDRMTTEELEEHLQANWWILKDKLLKGTYIPSPVRPKEIEKQSGGTRMLGIPTVQDRFIQQMLLQVMTPIFDPSFSEHSYGFRPRRSAQQAMRAAQEYVQGGREWVVDIDIAKFFDHVNHDTSACVPHSDGTDRSSDPGQAGVAVDREIPAAGSDGGRGSDSERGGDAARRPAVSAAGQYLPGCTGSGTGSEGARILPVRG
jgi:hypothetical protein